MRRRARRGAHLGSIWDAFGGAAEGVADQVADTATSVVDDISDAGKEIGAVLKFVAPIIALWPGIGTGIAVALEAAGAYASGDKIDDAVVETVSAALPGGPVPKALFTAGASVAQAAYRGQNVKAAVLAGMRTVASAVGGERAAAAFDMGVATARGKKIGDAAFQLARGQAQQGGTETLAAFDAAVTVANGGDAEDALLAAGHDYAATAGPVAAGLFDAGVAIGKGKSLQDAGFAAFKAFVAGNDLGERAEAFSEKFLQALKDGKPIGPLLADELVADVDKYGAAIVRSGVAEGAKEFISDKLDAILPRWDREWDDMGSFELASLLGVPELIARAAQAVMRDLARGGPVDQELLDRLTKTGIQTAIEKYGAAVVASTTTNESYTATRAAIRSDQLTLVARMPASLLSYAAAKAQMAPPPPPPEPTPAPAPAPTFTSSSSPPSSPRHSVAGDVALGAVCAAAAVALFWWAKN